MKTKIDMACHTAEEFTKLYYESVDKRRHVSTDVQR
jgi:NTF2-related export protein 1/2